MEASKLVAGRRWWYIKQKTMKNWINALQLRKNIRKKKNKNNISANAFLLNEWHYSFGRFCLTNFYSWSYSLLLYIVFTYVLFNSLSLNYNSSCVLLSQYPSMNFCLLSVEQYNSLSAWQILANIVQDI